MHSRPSIHDAPSAYSSPSSSSTSSSSNVAAAKRAHHQQQQLNNSAVVDQYNVVAASQRIYPQLVPPGLQIVPSQHHPTSISSSNRNHSSASSAVASSSSFINQVAASLHPAAYQPPPGSTVVSSNLAFNNFPNTTGHHPLFIQQHPPLGPPNSNVNGTIPSRDFVRSNERFAHDISDRFKHPISDLKHSTRDLNRFVALGLSNSNSIPSSSPSSTTSNNSSSSRRRPSLLLPQQQQNADSYNLALVNHNNLAPSSPSTLMVVNSSGSGGVASSPASFSNASSSTSSSVFSSSNHRYIERDKYDLIHSAYDHHRPQSSGNSKTSIPASINTNLPPPSSVISSTPGALYLGGGHHHPVPIPPPPGLHHHQTLLIQAAGLPPPLPPHHVQPSMAHQTTASHHSNNNKPSSHHHPQQQHGSSTLTSLQHNHLSHGHLLNEIYDFSNKRPRLISGSPAAAAATAAVNKFPGSIQLSAGIVPSSSGSSVHLGSSTLTSSGSIVERSSTANPVISEISVETISDSAEDGYNPHFEAISPPPNEEARTSPLTTAKDQILSSIHSIDREINTNKSQINNLQNKACELEAAVTSKPLIDLEDEAKRKPTREPSLAEKILNENLIKACNTKPNQSLPSFSEKFAKVPLYNRPIDRPEACQVVTTYHKCLRNRFIESIQQQNKENLTKKTAVCKEYDRLMTAWLKEMEKNETTPAKKSRDIKCREYFEKQFPELKKQREDRERLQRGQRSAVRSDVEMEELCESFQVQELEDKRMRSYVIIPPIMYTDDEIRLHARFVNKNCLVDDPMALYAQQKQINIWTEGEKEIFREKYLLNPKKFGIIAQFLERKSVADCVSYYYLSKKHENYKQLLSKHVKKRTRAMIRAQQQQQQQPLTAANGAQQNRLIRNGTDHSTGSRTTVPLKPYPLSTTSVILPYSLPLTSSSSTVTFTISSSFGSSSSTTQSSSSTVSISSNNQQAIASSSISTTNTTLNNNNNVAIIKCDNSDISNAANSAVASNGGVLLLCDNNVVCCLLCGDKVELNSLKTNNIVGGSRGGNKKLNKFAANRSSRLVTPSNAVLYGLTLPSSKQTTDSTSINAVCLGCHSKSVRRHCPIASCQASASLKSNHQTSKKVKPHHLKVLPALWNELSSDDERKQKWSKELNVPVEAKIGCSVCVKRVSKVMGIVSGPINSTKDQTEKSIDEIRNTWSENDLEKLRTLIKLNGKNWSTIAAALSSDGGPYSVSEKKTWRECRHLFTRYRNELNLSQAFKDFVKSSSNNGGGGANGNGSDFSELSDDFGGDESDDNSSTSFDFDDLDDVDQGGANSDTASASSSVCGGKTTARDHDTKSFTTNNNSLQNLKPLSLSQGSLKSDYDSSATMSADEGSNALDNGGNGTTNIINSSSSSNMIDRSTSSTFYTTGIKHGIELSMAGPTQVPTFLINPNAPSVHASSSASSNAVAATSAPPHKPQTTVEHTCVRDLIYKAIEKSLTSSSSTSSSSNLHQNEIHKNQNGMAIPLVDVKVEPSSTPTPPAINQPIQSLNNAKRESSTLQIHSIPSLSQQTTALHHVLHGATPDLSKMDMLASTAALHQQSSKSKNDINQKPEGLAMIYGPYGTYLPPQPPTHQIEPEIFEVQDLSQKSKDRKTSEHLKVASKIVDDHRSSSRTSSPLAKSPFSHLSTPSSHLQMFNYHHSPHQQLIQPAHQSSNQTMASRIPSMIDAYMQDPKLVPSQSNSRPPSRPFSSGPPSAPSISVKNMGSKSPHTMFSISPKSSTDQHHSRDKFLPPPPTTIATGGSITHGTPVVLQQQQSLSLGKYQQTPPPPPMGAGFPHLAYDAMLRQMTKGSITQGTPLVISGAPNQMGPNNIPPTSLISVANSPTPLNNRSKNDDYAQKRNQVSGNRNYHDLKSTPPYHDFAMNERINKMNVESAAAAAAISMANSAGQTIYRPFSPNYNATVVNKHHHQLQQQPLGLINNSGPNNSNNSASSQILIDFNTSKQMQPRRSSANDSKESHSQHHQSDFQKNQRFHHPTPHLAVDKSRPSSAIPVPHSNSQQLQISPSVLFSDRSGQIIRGPLEGPDKISVDQAFFPWNHLALGLPPPGTPNSVSLNTNRQNVIQQWNPVAVSKASVIQAPKSNSPGDFREPSDSVMKFGSLSQLAASGSSHHFPPEHDALATLVNAAVQQQSLSVPSSSVPTTPSIHSRLTKEGFEKCFSENSASSRDQQASSRQTNSNRVIYPPIIVPTEFDSSVTDLSNKSSKDENNRKHDSRPSQLIDSEMSKRFSPTTFMIPPSNSAEHEKFLHYEQQKKNLDLMMQLQGKQTQPPLPLSQQHPMGARFRSEFFGPNQSTNAAAYHLAVANAGLKFPREPFSSEHFERELRQMDPGMIAAAAAASMDQTRPSSKISAAENDKSARMDEASKLFSQSFQKDNHHDQSGSSGPGSQFTAVNLIHAIITHQINNDSTKTPSSIGNYPTLNRLKSSGNTSASSSPSSTPKFSSVVDDRVADFSRPPLPSTAETNLSMQDTIFNVIKDKIQPNNNIPPSSTSTHSNSSRSQNKIVFEGIAAAAAASSASSSSCTTTSDANHKLRKALQLNDGSDYPNKRMAYDYPVNSSPVDMMRPHQVIHLGNNSVPVTSQMSPSLMNKKTPITSSTPMYLDVTASSLANNKMIVGSNSSILPPPATSSIGKPGWSANMWPPPPPIPSMFMPPNFYKHQSPPPHFIMENKIPSQPPQQPQQQPLSNLPGPHGSYFTNRIAEAMRTSSTPTNNSSNEFSNNKETVDHDSKSQQNFHSGGSKPENNSSLSNSNDFETFHSNNNNKNNISEMDKYPDSPSSPGEMVIDENRPPSSPSPELPIINQKTLPQRTVSSPPSPSSSSSVHHSHQKDSNNQGGSNSSSSSSVIKLNNSSTESSGSGTALIEKDPVPQYEPLSDDE